MILACYRQPGPADLYLNGRPIPQVADPMTHRLMRLPTEQSTASPAPPLPEVSPTVPADASEAEALFIRTLHDLADSSMSNDWYRLLRTSGPLRLLLLDGLLHRANERVKHRPMFMTNDFRTPPPLETSAHWRRLSPEGLATAVRLELTLDEFLNAPVLTVEGTVATVKDVIRAAANASGGVHFGPPRGSAETVVLDFDRGAVVAQARPSGLALRTICRVVVQALYPIVATLQGDRTAVSSDASEETPSK